MKPKEQKSQSLRQAKGLARWGWIKRYLKPAMDYIGMSSAQFDRLFIDSDQVVNKGATEASPFPIPKIQVGGNYEPEWKDTTEGVDGYFYVEWRCAFNNKLITLDMVTPDYTSDGPPVFTDGFTPRFAFYIAEQLNQSSLPIRRNDIGLSDYRTIKMLLAARIHGRIYTFGYNSNMRVTYSYQGAQEIFFYPSGSVS